MLNRFYHLTEKYRKVIGEHTPDDVIVYLLALRKTDYYKIGMSRDMEKRIKTLQIGSPELVEVVGHIRLEDRGTARAIEKSFHETLDDFISHGEWFKLPIGIAHITREMFEHFELIEDIKNDQITTSGTSTT